MSPFFKFKLGGKKKHSKTLSETNIPTASASLLPSSQGRPPITHAASFQPELLREPENNLEQVANSAPPSTLFLPTSTTPPMHQKTHKRTPSWLKRSSISFDGILQRRNSCASNSDFDDFSSLHAMDRACFEETLKTQLCNVEAWKPMPSYFSGTTLTIIASEGEIVDPFRKEPPSPTSSAGKSSNAFFMARPSSSEYESSLPDTQEFEAQKTCPTER